MGWWCPATNASPQNIYKISCSVRDVPQSRVLQHSVRELGPEADGLTAERDLEEIWSKELVVMKSTQVRHSRWICLTEHRLQFSCTSRRSLERAVAERRRKNDVGRLVFTLGSRKRTKVRRVASLRNREQNCPGLFQLQSECSALKTQSSRASGDYRGRV